MTQATTTYSHAFLQYNIVCFIIPVYMTHHSILCARISDHITSIMKGTKVLTLGAEREVLPHNPAVTKM